MCKLTETASSFFGTIHLGRACKAAFVLTVAAILWPANAPAAVIATDSYVTVSATTDLTSGANLGTSGYQFSGFGGSGTVPTTVQPSYISTITLATVGFPSKTTGTKLTVNNVQFTSGFEYYYGGSSNSLLTLVLAGSGIPSSFQLGLLGDTGGAGNYTNYTVTDTTSGGAATADSISTGPQNDFYLFTISGASGGDTITVVGTPSATEGTNSALGGFTLDVPAPEPTVISLLAVSSFALLARRRGNHR